jgi:hypothetical protein
MVIKDEFDRILITHETDTEGMALLLCNIYAAKEKP